MKRIGLVLVVLLLATLAIAQSGSSQPQVAGTITTLPGVIEGWSIAPQNGSSVPAPTAAQQAEFAKVFADAQATEKGWSEISSPCNAALLRAQNANAQMNAVVFRIMAQMKLSPDEWEIKIAEGKLSFAPKPKEAPKAGGN